ncbi:MAG: histidine phosphatase family protein [Roseburia sp.]
MKIKKRWIALLILLVVAAVVIAVICYRKSQEKDELYVYLVTTAQTENQAKDIMMGGDANAPLTDQGVQQAKELGLGLMNVKFKSVYCSSTDRAKSTAEYILLESGQEKLSIHREQNLRDILLGDAEGLTRAQVADCYGDIFGDVTDETFVSPAGGESAYNFANRFGNTLLQLIQDKASAGGNMLVVAEDSAIYYLRQQFPAIVGDESLTEGGVCVLHYEDGDLTLEAFNDTTYLVKGQNMADTIPALQIDIIANPTTVHQEAGLLEGCTDSALSEGGIADVKRLVPQLSLGNVLEVYCSSMDRAAETESYVIKDDDMKITYTSKLDEMDFGDMESGSMVELELLYPSQMEQLYSEADYGQLQAPGGENGAVAAYRMHSALEDIVEEYQYSGGKVVVFTHPYILTAFMNTYFPEETYREEGSIRWISMEYENDFTILE